MKESIQHLYRRIKTSRRRWLRTGVGALLVICGLLGFLPVIGFWMIPLGLALLAVDWPVARRLHLYLMTRWHLMMQKLRDRSNPP